jgi:hypothetical protein
MKLTIPVVLLTGCLIGAGGILAAPSLLDKIQPGRTPHCYDAAVRFSESVNPKAALIQAVRNIGFNPYSQGNLFAQFLLGKATGPPSYALDVQTARWVGDALWQEHQRQTAMTLASYLADRLQIGRYLDVTPTPADAEAWAEMQSWPTDSCEGAFVRNPRNAQLLAPLARPVPPTPQ